MGLSDRHAQAEFVGSGGVGEKARAPAYSPGVVANLAAIGGAGLTLGFGGLLLPLGGAGIVLVMLGFVIGVPLAAAAAFMFVSSRKRKRQGLDSAAPSGKGGARQR